MNKIGYIQGRLSELVDGKIQAFPWNEWQSEFPLANHMGINLVEWTLDQEALYENPLMTESGRSEIQDLSKASHLSIPSLTGDCFMQAPFWKTTGETSASLKDDFMTIAHACSNVGIKIIVIPLVDNGRLDTVEQEDKLIEFLLSKIDLFREMGLRVAFESDYTPAELGRFVARLDADVFGINYDIGNSSALGFDPTEEFAYYGDRVINVHVKDRLLAGTTVPLGNGAAEFDKVFQLLAESGYAGNYILQTARSETGKHQEVLKQYFVMTKNWLTVHGT